MTRELLASDPTATRPAAGSVPSDARPSASSPSAGRSYPREGSPGALSVVDVFVAAGLAAHQTDQLGRALEELAVRLEVDGAGGLLAAITNETCWVPHSGVCPVCGGKKPPDPHPKPKPPPPPPPRPRGQAT